VFSRITLAFLEDMGWYTVDYAQAEYLEWGKGLGCQFVTEPCPNWKGYGYFCNEIDAKSCTSNRNSIGYCNLAKVTKVPASFRYFSSPTLAGSDELADYCPYIQAYANGLCTDVHNKPSHADVLGSDYGPDSRCFDSSLAKLGYTTKETIQPMCYNYRCPGSKLEVQIDGSWYDCPFGGVVENIAGFNGFLKCPDRNFCTGHGTNIVSHSPSKNQEKTKNSNNKGENKSTFDFDFGYLVSGDDDSSNAGSSAFGFLNNSEKIIISSNIFFVVVIVIFLHYFK